MTRLKRNVRKFFDIANIAASKTINAGLFELQNLRTLSVTFKATYNASGTDAATLEVYYSPDGESWDTVVFDSWNLDLTAGSEVQETKHYSSPEHGFLMFKIKNNDAKDIP